MGRSKRCRITLNEGGLYSYDASVRKYCLSGDVVFGKLGLFGRFEDWGCNDNRHVIRIMMQEKKRALRNQTIPKSWGVISEK